MLSGGVRTEMGGVVGFGGQPPLNVNSKFKVIKYYAKKPKITIDSK